MYNFDADKQFAKIKEAAVGAVKEIFPVDGKIREIRLDRVWVEDTMDSKDYSSQSQTKRKDGTWGAPVYASLTLIEKATKNVIDKADKVKLFTLPKLTDRLSYIVGGNEYQVHSQLRLKPGVYTLRKQNGELKTQVNLARGKNFDLIFNERTGVFFIQKIGGGQANIPLYPILTYLGLSAPAISKAWTSQVESANKRVDANAVQRAAAAFGVKTGDLKDYFSKTEISPETTKLVLGKEFDRVDGPMLLAASQHLLEVHLGKKEATDRDSLVFKEIHGVEDYLQERIQKNKQSLAFKLKRSIDNVKRTKLTQLVNPGAFSSVVESFFTQDDKSSTPEQTNPLEMITGAYRTTIMGSGGIQSHHAITKEMREIHPSHYGFLDPAHTPESSKIGANLNLPMGVVKDGKELKSALVDKNGKSVFLTPAQSFEKYVAFPNQKGNMVKAMYRGKVIEIPRTKVDYFTPRPEALFSISTNLVPYLPSNQGNRVMMASKMLEQAIALKHREAPLVQVGIGPTTTERALGQQVAVLAPDSGTIKKVTSDFITMKLDSGEERKLPLYNNFALNRKSFLHHEAKVKEGQRVKKGDLLADSNYTKDGTLALGANFRVAYLPYHGLNFEDGVVVTESAAKKLTSEHIHKKSLDINENVVLRLQAFTSFYPNALTPDNRKKLDPDGVIKKGEKIKQGEALIAVLQKRAPSKIVATISRVLSDRPKDASVYWTLEDDGVVMDVQRSGGRITIFVKTEEPAKIGDKLSGRMGNKGIITKIISDDEAPRNKKNEPVDIILNPHGIISRINIGQLYESAAGKAALKSGAAHRVDNFSGEDYLQSTRKFLKEQGISDKEELIDPTSGKSLGKVHVGNPYILKLFKQGTVNFSVRQGGPGQPYDANMQPLKAGGEEAAKSMDLLTVYSMLSHGARANLREMSSIKSNQNDEFWKALKSGQQMPPPKAPFVYDKFMGYLKGAGVNVEKEGTKLTLTPFTDAQVRGMSNGEIKKPLFYRGKDIKKDVEPMKGGFFDPIITGGIKGSKWAHVELKEPVINPVFENAARKLTGLGGKFDEIMAGKLFLGADGKLSKDGKGLTGGRAMEALLKKIDVDKEIAALTKKAEKATGSVLDDMNKRLRYLKALKDNKMSPNEAYMRKVLPVVPPSFRPLYPLPDGNITTSDVNILYQNTGVLNEMMKLDVMDLLPEEEKADLRKDLYEHVKGVSGLTDLNIKGRVRDGFISEIKGGSGGQPKEGFFISKMLSKKQDFVGRGTIIPEPDLGVDEVGLPEEMAWKLFEPFVVRELKNHGKNPLQAKEEIKAKTPLAKKALEIVMRDRHVLLNRAPSLHKFSIMAFKPQITAGRAIKIPPLVVSGFNADFDGDEQLTFILTHLTKEGISHCVDKYGLTFVEDRIMTARFKEQVPALNGEGELLVFHLEDFPHGEIIGSKEGEKGRIDFFKALPGTRVVSYDEKTNSLQWKEVFGWSKHYQREIEIVNLSSGRQILTDDDPRAVYGVERGSLSMSRNTPTHALEKGMLVPRAHKLDSVAKEDAVGRIRKEFTPEMGYLMGCVVANGWVENSHGEHTGRIFISTTTPEVGNKFLDDSDKVFGIAGKRLNYEAKNRENRHGDSMKWGFYHQEAAVLLSSAVGLGARNKHLPPYFLTAPEKFRLSLFAGLMDNDGSISVSNAKSKPQLMANYSTASVRLAQDVQLLAQSLGIRCRITSSKTPAGEGFWVCSFSSIDIKKWECHGMVHPGKREKFASCPVDGDSPVAAKYDVVPVSSVLAEALCKAIGAPREGAPERKSLYAVFNKAKSGGSVSRISAERVLKWVPEHVCKTLPDWDLWWGIVKNTDVTWDEVESVEKTGIREDGYDLTVPGYETFMNVDGVVLSNTMTAHIPITPEANEEAKKMLPSANLFKPGTGTLMIAPSQEAQVGLFYLSKTPQGRGVINNLVGAKFKIDHVLDKKTTRALLTRMAKEMPPQEYAKAVALLKKEGEKHAYESGFTIGLDDLADMRKERDKVVAYAEREAKKAKTEEQLSKVTATSQQLMDKVIENKLKDKKNPLYDMVSSGARGDKSQLRSIVASPLFVTDARGKTIARPIKKSYSEGLDVSDYWLSMYGARRGGMDRAIQTSLPGAFSKDIMASTIDNVVSSVDCGTKNGVQMKVDDVEALDRYLAGDHLGVAHNTLIDHNVITTLKKKGVQLIKVRSALTCLQAKGVCSKCHGIDEHGADPGLGDNVGAKAGQTIAEPLVQLVMNTRHTGGVAGTGADVGGYQRIDQLLKLPKTVHGAAALATKSGQITKIEPGLAGGFNVFIGTEKVFVTQGRKLYVKVGSKVQAGDPLSDGVIKPQELVKYKGMQAAQQYIVDELHSAYKNQGVGIQKRVFETIVRSLGNTTRVVNNSKDSDYLPGDIVPYTVANHYNQNLIQKVPVEESTGMTLAEEVPGLQAGKVLADKDITVLKSRGIKEITVKKDAIKHVPLLKGISTLPLLRKDWMSSLGYRYLAKSLTEGAAQRWSTDIGDYHPVPALAHGATFGQGKDGKY